jgi:hypothetical protein
MHTVHGVRILAISLESAIYIAKTAIGAYTNAGAMATRAFATTGNVMQTETSQSIFDPIEDQPTVATQWVESVTLPTYSNKAGGWQGDRGRNTSKFATLQRNYTFIKHMMTDMGIDNNDFLIVRDIDNTSQITIKFNNRSQPYASMAVLMWSKYKDAKLESNL